MSGQSDSVGVPQVEPTRPKPSKRGFVVPHEPVWYQKVAGWIIVAIIRLIAATLRREYQDRSTFFTGSPKGPAIYCVWHNRLGLCLPSYYGYARKKIASPGMAAMCSASKDGAFLAAILQAYHVQPVRGSSSRRGPQALLELTTWADKGYDLAITPDGPRGPRYVVQHGVISLAQITGLPIVACSYELSSKIQLKSWDRFQVPLPFSRCIIRIAGPFRVSRDASDAEREQVRQELQSALTEMTVD